MVPVEKSPSIGLKPLSLCGLLLLAGCAGGSASRGSPSARAGSPGGSSATEEAAVAAALKQITIGKTDYKIGPADLLQVSVFEQKDMDREVRVSQNGTVSLPLTGNVKVGGLSSAEAEALIAEKLKEYLVKPQVTLFIREYGNKKIFVLGEVRKPGSFELPTESKMTVLEAVTLAGGFTPIAAPDRTKVMRMVDGKSQSIAIEVSAITHHGQKQKDIALEPNDIVYVPQSFF